MANGTGTVCSSPLKSFVARRRGAAILVLCHFVSPLQSVRILSNETIFPSKSFSTYDVRMRPNFSGPAVKVGVRLDVIHIGSISTRNMEFTLSLFLRQKWKDARLANVTALESDGSLHDVEVKKEHKIWMPDTFIVNDKGSVLNQMLTKNYALRISPDGTVTSSVRITTRLSCSMDLSLFPLDTQICSLVLESYGYRVNEVKYEWEKGRASLHIARNVATTKEELIGYRMKSSKLRTVSAKYSRLQCDFLFERSRGYYLIRFYIPACLITILSWLTFWMRHTNNPIRWSFNILTVFLLVWIMVSKDKILPSASYVKAIDVYLFVCLVYGVTAFAEAMFVEYVEKEGCKAIIYIYPRNMDKYCRVIFLVFFLVFNVLYWAVYLSVNEWANYVIPYQRKSSWSDN